MAYPAPAGVIVRAAPALSPAEAARRVSAGDDPIWLSSPGLDTPGGRDVAVDVVAAGPRVVVRGGALGALEDAWTAARARWRGAPGIPVGVGWLSYDLARAWIAVGGALETTPGDGFEFRFFDALWIRDVATGTARVVACDEDAAARLEALLARPAPPPTVPRIGPFQDAHGQEAHRQAVVRIKDYLLAGDAYQVNLARRLTAAMGEGDPLWLAAALRADTPAPHAVWMGARRVSGGAIDSTVIGNSPERFLRLSPARELETQPIKGTRPRSPDPQRDAALRAELLASPKDRAEHVMIVDLERNDLGRVCEIGSVRVHELMRVLELPTVFHLVSTVRGRLRADVGLAELVRACFPGGSVTGAPKQRAMQIIEELEPVRRGIYTGATGWLGAAGDLDLAVAIRTATVSDGTLSLFVGGGIVADSEPATEWDETEVKARAFRVACDAAAGAE
ncbi:MAG TPA: anthranilate synthase component I family protein [Polyangia bacterium]|nr:anthranilate synthase component I family protein [Polyangia bacterium]